MNTTIPDLTGVTQIMFTGERVTLEPGGELLIDPSGWIATGWDQGLPVSRKPISLSEVHRLLATYPYELRYQ